jgi:rubrerythrin
VSITEEEPGVGTYECTICGTSVRLDNPDDTLPPCPICNNTEFVKVS